MKQANIKLLQNRISGRFRIALSGNICDRNIHGEVWINLRK